MREFIQSIEKCLEDESRIQSFREVFKKYKTTLNPNIDDFTLDLFGVFFDGHRDHAVSHLDITKYD